MTVKELASFCGKNKSTIGRWIEKAGCKMQSISCKMQQATPDNPSDFTLDEVEAILRAGSMSKDAVSILMENARNNQRNVYQANQNNSLSDREIEMITKIVSTTVAMTIEQLDKRMSKIETRIENRAALLPPPAIKPRDHINMLIRKYSSNNNLDYKIAWDELYLQFGYRTNSNPKLCAKNRGMSIIDYIETEGQIEILESIAMEMCSAS